MLTSLNNSTLNPLDIVIQVPDEWNAILFALNHQIILYGPIYQMFDQINYDLWFR